MSGAHYEIIRRLVRSSALPPVAVLRSQLLAAWELLLVEQRQAEVKLFPMRAINTGVNPTLSYVASLGVSAPPAVLAFAYELEAARDIVTQEAINKLRPQVLSTNANRNYFALEEVERIFMLSFLREVQKRAKCPSVIWLHDGVWIHRDVPDSLLQHAEVLAARAIALPVDVSADIMRIRDLRDEATELYGPSSRIYALIHSFLPR